MGAYGPFVRMGQKYIYSIQAPQRATLAIEKQPGGKWVIGELRAACNKEAGIETYRAVEEWLEDRQEVMGDKHS